MADPGAPVDDISAQRQAGRVVLATVAAGLALRGLVTLRSAVINTDGPTFMSIAAGFLAGNPSAATEAGFHPLYPALAALFGGGETGAMAVSAVAGALAGWPLWLLVRDLGGSRAAFLSLIVYELHPSLIKVQSAVFADGVFMLLAVGAASGAIRYVRGGPGVWMASIAAGLAFLTKSEGLIVVVLTLGTLAIGFVRRPDGKRSGLEAAGAALIMILIATPYILHLSLSADRFQFSPKAVVEQAMRAPPAADLGPGKWLERRHRHGPLVASAWYVAHSTMVAVGHGHLVLFAAAALTWKLWRNRLAGQAWLALWIGFYVLCVWWTCFRTGHQVSERYVHPPVALALSMLGAFGAWALVSRNGQIAAWPARIAAALLVAVAVAPAVEGQRQDQIVLREAGMWILKAHGPGAVISSPVDKIPYYARGVSKPFQTEPPSWADFWVFTEKDAQSSGWNWRAADLRPFKHLATLPERPDPGSKVVHILGRTGSR